MNASPPNDLIERLCRSLAFHVVESELTLQFAEGDTSPWQEECANAKALIAEAGFDLDVLYPLEDRPTASEANPQLPPDVVRLVIAARVAAFEDQSPEAIRELDQASEAFASRVPWEDEPSAYEAVGVWAKTNADLAASRCFGTSNSGVWLAGLTLLRSPKALKRMPIGSLRPFGTIRPCSQR